ncbi:MAG: hypothetical protein LBF97_07930 [Elusimicrobiota bacterium]|jgi:Skp family chaperone for outer membrane proteins|nr:hypothetical protein [Elusimicrobiota bacterium]
MKYKILILLVFLTFFSIFSKVQAIILPTEKNGVIDIETVFEEYYKTKEYRIDIENKKDQFRKSLIYKQKNIVILIDNYNIIVSSINLINQKNNTKAEEIPKIDKETDFNFIITPPKDMQEPKNLSGTQVDKEMQENLAEETKQMEVEKDKLTDKEMQENLAEETKQVADLENIDKMEVERDKLKQEIEKLKEAFFSYRDITKAEIEKLEEEYLYSVLDEIYIKIAFVSQKYGYSIIFDKKDLVFSEKYFDLTNFMITEINKVN